MTFNPTQEQIMEFAQKYGFDSAWLINQVKSQLPPVGFQKPTDPVDAIEWAQALGQWLMLDGFEEVIKYLWTIPAKKGDVVVNLAALAVPIHLEGFKRFVCANVNAFIADIREMDVETIMYRQDLMVIRTKKTMYVVGETQLSVDWVARIRYTPMEEWM